MALRQYISEQEMQANLASRDCIAAAQWVAVHFIHDIENAPTVTPLHEIHLEFWNGFELFSTLLNWNQ